MEFLSIPVNPQVPSMVPSNIYDAWWVLSTIVIIALMSATVFFLRRMVEKIDNMAERIGDLSTAEAVTKAELEMHISDEGKHCKQGLCVRRTVDNG